MRVQALLRRAQWQQGIGTVLSAHGIEVDLQKRAVTVGGQPVELRPMEYDILVTFMQRPGQTFSHRNLADLVWGLDAVATDHTVTHQVNNLRERLGKYGQFIETVPKIGYRLAK